MKVTYCDTFCQNLMVGLFDPGGNRAIRTLLSLLGGQIASISPCLTNQ